MQRLQCCSLVFIFLIVVGLFSHGHCSPSGLAKSRSRHLKTTAGTGTGTGTEKISSDSMVDDDNENDALSTDFGNKTKSTGANSTASSFSSSKGSSIMALFSNFPFEEIIAELITGTNSNSNSNAKSNSKSNSNMIQSLEKMKKKLLNQFGKKTEEMSTGRQGYGGPGAHGFPSLEGALLSIAFLTFAVFLIDLIQQLLSRIRTGTANVVPLVGRRRRSIFPEDEQDSMMDLTSSVIKSVEMDNKFKL